MEFSELNADIRTKTGNGPGRALRREGRMPAILYGPGTEPMPLAVNIMEFERALKNSNTRMAQTVFNLNIQDGNKRSAMVKELQRHPLTGAFLHADFYEVAMDRKVKVKVPIITKGIAKGIDFGGMLQVIRRELDVRCFPNEIPNNIEIDVTELNVGDAIHVKDLKPEGNIEIIEDAEFTVLTLLGKKAEKEAVDTAVTEGEESAAAEPAAAAKAKPEAKAKAAKSK